jgi:MOSC domain-containing protein YiiM
MKLISVNVSLPKEIQYKGESVTTGIFKEPVQGRVVLRELNLDGDGQADLTVHGGIHQAVYVYPFEHYDYWKQKLGRQDLPYGQFGENFTVAEMREDQVHIGDIFRLGSAMVQITQPRVPCYKLALRMNLPQFPKLFMTSGRTGFYLRVLHEGEVGASDAIERIETAPDKMTVQEVFHLAFRDHDDREALTRALRLRSLSPGWHSMFAERLAAR